MNVKNNTHITKLICIGWFLFGFICQNNLRAQIGSIGSFSTTNLVKKNELALSVGRICQRDLMDLNSYDVQVAYAFHQYLAVQAGYYNYIKPHRRTTVGCITKNCEKEYINHSFYAAIGGFYKHDLRRTLFRKNKKRSYRYTNKSHLLFDVYLSYGKSINKQSYYLGREPRLFYPNSVVKFNNYHLQSNFWLNTTFAGAGFSVMYGFIDFSKIELTGIVPDWENFIETLTLKSVSPFYGVQFKIWAGTKHLKLVYSIKRKTFIDNRLPPLNLNNYFNDVYFVNYLYYGSYLKQLALQINLAVFKKKT